MGDERESGVCERALQFSRAAECVLTHFVSTLRACTKPARAALALRWEEGKRRRARGGAGQIWRAPLARLPQTLHQGEQLSLSLSLGCPLCCEDSPWCAWSGVERAPQSSGVVFFIALPAASFV